MALAGSRNARATVGSRDFADSNDSVQPRRPASPNYNTGLGGLRRWRIAPSLRPCRIYRGGPMLLSRASVGLLLLCCLLAGGCASNCCLLRGNSCGDVCGDVCGCEIDSCGDICKPKSMAFERYKGCGCPLPKICVCTGPECGTCDSCPSCGCDEPVCGCSGAVCEKKPCCLSCLGSLIGRFKKSAGCGDACCGDTCCGDTCCEPGSIGGCDCELYWSEWHNDPPRCCDPCDKCGNWVGPAAGAYKAPYDHAYSP